MTKCPCGRVKSAQARVCRRHLTTGHFRPSGRPVASLESARDIDRKLAQLDKLKRRTRWAA